MRRTLGASVVIVLLTISGIALSQSLSGPEIIPLDYECDGPYPVSNHQAFFCLSPEPTSSTTSSSSSTTSSTTTSSTSTSTTMATTTTTAPPFEADQCVIDQIAREPFKSSGDGTKTAFDIILTQINPAGPGTPLWDAPYVVDLGNGYGWISGDRAGYKGAYMFLVDLDTAEVHARVLFRRVGSNADAYFKVNDRYMNEIQTTMIGYDGTCADPVSQDQLPSADQEYEVDNSPEVRPIIPISIDGVLVEDRSYTNTQKLSDEFIFDDGGLITEPFTTTNGLGTFPHTVYERQIVFVKIPVDGEFFIAGVVYYDMLTPNASME